MLQIIFSFLLLVGFSAYAQNGIVNVQTHYSDVSDRTISTSFNGRGFIVDYPVMSFKTQRVAQLKVMLTASHLVFGGIYEDGTENYRIFESETKNELHALGMISDVIHDTAAVIICTKEAVEFFSEEIENNNLQISHSLKESLNPKVESFGCPAFSGESAAIEIKSFATYSGSPISIQSGKNENSWMNNDKSMSSSKIIVNSNQRAKFIISNKSYAVPFNDRDPVTRELVLETSTLKELLVPREVPDYSSTSAYPRHHVTSFDLESDYSGSPVLYYDQRLKEMVIIGVYKSSDSSRVINGNHGWLSPIEMSYGLVDILVNRTLTHTKRWHTVPDAYMFVNKGHILKKLIYSNYLLFEDVGLANGNLRMSGSRWVSTETGENLWLRSSNGEHVSTEPQLAKQLKRVFYQENETFWEDTISFLLLPKGDNVDFILLPPTLNSMMMSAEHICVTCVDSFKYNINKENNVAFFSQDEDFALVDMFWLKLSLDEGTDNFEPKTKAFRNSRVEASIQNMDITYTMIGETIKIHLSWEQDHVEFYILENNSLSFQNSNRQWQQVPYSSVLETVTHRGRNLLLETAGIIYYNTELPNPSSFRIKYEGSNTELFELVEPM